jgi:hypothetical protein
MPSTSIVNRLRGQRDALVDELAEAITVEGGRRDGSDETRVTIDRRYPDVPGEELDRQSAGACGPPDTDLRAHRSPGQPSRRSTAPRRRRGGG